MLVSVCSITSTVVPRGLQLNDGDKRDKKKSDCCHWISGLFRKISNSCAIINHTAIDDKNLFFPENYRIKIIRATNETINSTADKTHSESGSFPEQSADNSKKNDVRNLLITAMLLLEQSISELLKSEGFILTESEREKIKNKIYVLLHSHLSVKDNTRSFSPVHGSDSGDKSANDRDQHPLSDFVQPNLFITISTSLSEKTTQSASGIYRKKVLKNKETSEAIDHVRSLFTTAIPYLEEEIYKILQDKRPFLSNGKSRRSAEKFLIWLL